MLYNSIFYFKTKDLSGKNQANFMRMFSKLISEIAAHTLECKSNLRTLNDFILSCGRYDCSFLSREASKMAQALELEIIVIWMRRIFWHKSNEYGSNGVLVISERIPI